MMSMPDTLLVGSEGYIGSNCPYAVDKLDLKFDEDFLEATPVEYQTIIFLASRLGDNRPDYAYNESLYRQLDNWLLAYPHTHVIYSSSAAVYGEGERPHREYDLPEPINLYGKSKLSGEFHVREYKQHTVLRFGNVYGRMNGQSGHGVTELFQEGQNTIFGDGEQVRDFVTVNKIWEIITLARLYPQYWQGVYNVSSAKPVTINEWYERYGVGEPQHIAPRAGDIYKSILDNKKMKSREALCQ